MANRTATQPTRDAISLRAYQFFASRGYKHGRDLDDWLQAEAQLKAEVSKPTRARKATAGAGADSGREPSATRKKSG
jgi:hypothetical protein